MKMKYLFHRKATQIKLDNEWPNLVNAKQNLKQLNQLYKTMKSRTQKLILESVNQLSQNKYIIKSWLINWINYKIQNH